VVSRRVQWIAGIAAVLIAVIVIATFALVRGNFRPQTAPAATPTPRANASPTPLENELNVPETTPVILYHDPAKFDQIDGLTWYGSETGMVTGGVIAIGNPTNNLFGQPSQILDRHGHVVATGQFGAKSWQGTWADDALKFCQMVPFDYLGANGVPATLQLVALGQAPKNIVRVGKVYEQSFIRVAACSTEADRAVVVQSGGQGVGTAQYWVVQLSTGRILWTHNFQETTGPVLQIVSSHDGRYIAEVDGATSKSTIYGPDGRLVMRIDESVDLFSWDDSIAVTSRSDGAVTLTHWQDGSVIWVCPPGNYGFVNGLAEPGGTRIAVFVSNTGYGQSDSTGFTPADLFVLTADGLVVAKVSHVHTTG
jgi:hypothetical protein